MITANYIPLLDRVYFDNIGVFKVDTMPNGTHIIGFDIAIEELNKCCEDLLRQVEGGRNE